MNIATPEQLFCFQCRRPAFAAVYHERLRAWLNSASDVIRGNYRLSGTDGNFFTEAQTPLLGLRLFPQILAFSSAGKPENCNGYPRLRCCMHRVFSRHFAKGAGVAQGLLSALRLLGLVWIREAAKKKWKGRRAESEPCATCWIFA
jgi:hypothetical protein